MPTPHNMGIFLSGSRGTLNALDPTYFLQGCVIIPGSFNPLHEGHRAIYRYFKNLGITAVLEISSTNADKGKINLAELEQRAKIASAEINGYCIIDSASLFKEKKSLYKGLLGFAVGIDTMLRVIDPKYGPDPKDVVEGLTWYVFSREINGVYTTLPDIIDKLDPYASVARFVDVRLPKYTAALSSTEIRLARSKQD